MGQRPLISGALPSLLSPLWFSFDSSEEDKELWVLEQEVIAEMERTEQRHCETVPVGKSGNETTDQKLENICLTLSNLTLDTLINQLPTENDRNPHNSQSYVDEDDEDDEEEDDNDDEESESHDDDDEEEIDMEVEDRDSPTF